MAEALKNEPKIDADEVLTGIVEWVSIESPSHDAGSVNKVVDHVEGQFRDLGLKLERIPGRDGFGDILECKTTPEMSREAGKGILVVAHLDTVHPIGMIEKDLKIRREGDSVFGPGIYDMKAGGYIAYYALRHLIRQGKKTKLPVTFLFIPEEEVGSPTSRARIEETARGHKYALVMEPGRDGDKVVTSRKGVGRFTLRVEGIGAHAGGSFQNGASAVVELSHQILALHAMVDYDAGITLNAAPIWGGSRPNVISPDAGCEIDLRVNSVQDGVRMEQLILGLESRTAGCRVTVQGGMNRPPYTENPGILSLYETARGIAGQVGIRLPRQHRGGGSDGNFTAALGVPTLDGLGCPGAGAHASHEHILWSHLAARAALMAGLLETLD